MGGPYYVSGPPIEHLKSGWAKIPFIGKRSHYWNEDTTTMLPTINAGRVRFYEALCGELAAVNAQTPALYGGTCPRCKNCERKKAKA